MPSKIEAAVISPALIAVCLLLSGCDLGLYEERRANAMRNVANKAAAITIPGKGGANTGVSFTLPQILGKGSDPLKAVAGPLNVDGLVGMYEPGGTGGGPMLLLGGVPTAEGPLDKVVANVTAAMQAVAPGQQVQAGDVRPS